MNELIKETEKLYKQIDNAQVHLVNSRLNNDEEGKKSAISEMETAMCDAMQLLKCFIDRKDNEQKTDNVNHPSHYNSHPSGIECIEIARHHNFNIGNTIKYLWRAGLKSEEGMEDTDKQIEDLNKAIWYIQDEIKRITEFKKKRIMVNLNECKRNKTEQEAQDAIVEKFIEDTMHLVEIADREVIDYIDTHIPLPYGLKQ